MPHPDAGMTSDHSLSGAGRVRSQRVMVKVCLIADELDTRCALKGGGL